MGTKRKTGGVGIAVILMIALVNAAFENGGIRSGISVLYVLIVVGIVFAVIWAVRRSRLHARRGEPLPKVNPTEDADRSQRPSWGTPLPEVNPPEDARRSQRRARRGDPLPKVNPTEAVDDEEQWRSLLEAGLITREEYRERFGGTGRG